MKNDDIKQILEEMRIPKASEEARKLAVFNALEEFDKINKKTTQGSSWSSRLMDMFNQLDRRINMRKSYYYGASFAAIVLTLGVLTFDELGGDFDKDFSTKKSDSKAFYPLNDRAGTPIVIPAPQQPEPLPALEAPQSPSIARPEEKTVTLSQDTAAVSAKPAPMKSEFSRSDKLANTNQAAMYAPPPPPVAPGVADGYSGGAVGGQIPTAAPYPGQPYPYDQWQVPQNNDKFEKTKTNPVKLVSEEPVSTFSIDVDTSSYSFVRRSLNMAQWPTKDSVRIEEMVNYFDYNYAVPESKSQPFKPSVTVLPSPWHKGNKLVHIGIKGYDIAPNEKTRSNLVFLIDTSGSMSSPDKLPLLINSLSMLVNTLDEDSTVSIVTYAGWAGTALEPTKVKDKNKILSVLQSLQSGGGTAGAAGISQAYALAEKNFDKNGVNRVILATDGDFNVGISDPEELQKFIEKKRETGIFLSVLGFGQGNYNDALMQKLAQNGNGNAAYIDNINEARKVLVEEASSTLFPIAKDVKIQVEFNKSKVSEYRLIGYETRILNREDFNNDKVDAGEIGSGHAVTAIYEITPRGEKGLIDESRYGKSEERTTDASNEYGFLKIRYKLPKENTSKLIDTPITASNEVATVDAAPADVKFAVSVAAFGQLLHGDSYTGEFVYDDIIKLAISGKGEDKFGYRNEFINLVRTAKSMPGNEPMHLIKPELEPQPLPAPGVYR